MESWSNGVLNTASLRDSSLKANADGKTAGRIFRAVRKRCKSFYSSTPTLHYSITPWDHVVVILLLLLTVTAQADVLFLAHFDKAVPGADYSAGGQVSASATGGARGGESGYFPGTPGGAADIGYHTPATASLVFPAKGNIDTRQGTIEFFLKAAWDWDIKEVPEGNPRHVSVPLPDGGLIRVYTYIHAPSKKVSLGLHIRDAQGDHVITYNASPVKEGKAFWKKDEWRHVAASWNAKASRLFLDGRLVAEKSWEPNLSLPPFQLPNAMISIGGQGGRATRVLIDELRITDSVNVYGP
jgi:hypothetical protein